jgi:hypothetical protein
LLGLILDSGILMLRGQDLEQSNYQPYLSFNGSLLSWLLLYSIGIALYNPDHLSGNAYRIEDQLRKE